ncbi:YcxB family protein (plasmid) [Rhizobium leguminosarum]
MTLSDDAVRVTSRVADSTVPWTSVKRVIREKSYLMLPISKREAFILPRRGFETEERFNDAWRYASKQISAGLA